MAERNSLEWAKDLAKDTARMLGYDYCVLQNHPFEGEFMAYSREYVADRLYCGEVGHSQVVVGYRPTGEEIDREDIWKTR